MVGDGDQWMLPSIASEERRSADVSELNRAVRELLGLEVSVLRCLSDEPGDGEAPRRHLYVLEAHGDTGRTTAAVRWMPERTLGADPGLGIDARRALDTWRRAEAPPSPSWRPEASVEADSTKALASPGAPEWTRPGWRDGALAWATDALSPRGYRRIAAVEQIRLWEFSHVLRLSTGEARFYLKARPADGVAEAPLTQRLSDRHPAWMPEVVAVERARRWLLTCEAAGPGLMTAADPACWERAASAIAHMQIDWLPATRDLAALGCPRLTLAALEREIAPLLGDTAALQPRSAAALGEGDAVLGQGLRAPQRLAEGLTDDEIAALRARRPELEARCGDLARAGVPESLEHGDLWGDNVIAREDAVVFIDWEDAAIAHPFFTPSLLLLSLDYTEALERVPDARRRIRDAYLGPWRERGPLAGWSATRLEQVFELAQPVAMLHYARQFWRLALPLIETSWEVRAFVPMFLRRLLAF